MYVNNLLYCVDVNLICIAILFVVKMYTGYSKLKSLSSIATLNKITYVSLLFCVYDLSLYFLSKFVLDDDHTVVIVCDTVYLILYALLCFLCFVFAIAELKMIKLSAKSLVLSAVPGIITIFAAVIIMLMLSVSENTSEIKSLLLGCGIILTCYYVVIFLFQLFYFILKKKMRFNSKSITLTTLYFFFILLSIALQWFFFKFYLPQIFFTFFLHCLHL